MSLDQTVLEAKRIGVFTCTTLCPLVEAARRMVAEDVSALVVVDDGGCLAGIITRTDLLRASQSSPDWQCEPVQTYMSSDVVVVTEDTCLAEVAKLLLEKQIHRVVVIREQDGKQHPLSVVSAADLLYHMVN